MNKVIIKGKITRDIEVKEASTKVSRFTVAIKRMKKDESDFISCVAFGTQAEFLKKYFSKGQEIAIVGRLQTGSYDDKDGKRVYTTDVIVEEIEFCGAKTTQQTTQQSTQQTTQQSTKQNTQVTDEELPF